MADKKNLSKNNKKNKKGSSDEKIEKTSLIMTIILVVVLVLILLGGFIAFVKLDIGSFGSKVLAPLIKDVPVVNKILPDDGNEEIKEESEYPYKSIEEAADRVIELEKEIDKLKTENDDIYTKVDELKAENKRLKEFESEQEEFEKLKKQFDEEIVYGDDALDASEYAKYYEQMNPETAQEIYKQVIKDQQASEEIKELANTYSKMDSGAAAAALEKQTDISMVCDILNNMSQKSRAAIMDEMSSGFAAKVTSNMYTK